MLLSLSLSAGINRRSDGICTHTLILPGAITVVGKVLNERTFIVDHVEDETTGETRNRRLNFMRLTGVDE